jgi:hypothetical protein
MDLSALPAAGPVLSGGLFLFVTAWTELRIFGRRGAAGLLPAGILPLGSVGLIAVEQARRLSRGKIVTGGIDFSFTPDAYHARSTPAHRDKLRRHNRFQDLFSAAAAFSPAAFKTVSKSGFPARSDPAMRNYRDLFEREFAADPRLFDITGGGLPLGLRTLSPEAAFDVLAACGARVEAEERRDTATMDSERRVALTEKLKTFIQGEQNRLLPLRRILSGEEAADAGRLDTLVGDCDYLWAHFPDYAGAGGRRPDKRDIAAGTPEAVSFLKRLRAEIDPALALLERTIDDLYHQGCAD